VTGPTMSESIQDEIKATKDRLKQLEEDLLNDHENSMIIQGVAYLCKVCEKYQGPNFRDPTSIAMNFNISFSPFNHDKNMRDLTCQNCKDKAKHKKKMIEATDKFGFLGSATITGFEIDDEEYIPDIIYVENHGKKWQLRWSSYSGYEHEVGLELDVTEQ